MPLIHCPHCDRAITVAESVMGTTGRCAECGERFIVQLDAAQRSSERDRPVGARKGKRTKKRSSAAGSSTPRIVWFAIGGGALLLLFLALAMGGLIWWLSGRHGGSGGGAGVGEGIAAEPQEPAPGSFSWVAPPIPAADPASWKVTPDPAPLSNGLLSAFPIADADVRGAALAGPASPKAAIIQVLRNAKRGSPQLEWLQYDLHKAEPAARVPIMPMDYPPSRQTKILCALSPSGEHLAVEFQRTVKVWSAKGSERASFQAPYNKVSSLVEAIGFASDDRLLTLADRRVTVFDPATGKKLYVVSSEFLAPPIVSPGGKWIVAYTGKAYEFFAAADGRKSGTLPLPDHWEDQSRHRASFAFHPGGKLAAGFTFNNQGNLLVTVWDLTGGAIKESLVVYESYDSSSSAEFPVIWSGDRRLVFASGEVLDLDLHTYLCKYEIPSLLPLSGPSPDGRFWRLARPSDEKGKRLTDKAGGGGLALAAASLPHPAATAMIDKARDGFLWHPGSAIRVEVDNSVPDDQREKLLQAMSEAAAKAGARVDPAANVRLSVTVKLERGTVRGKVVKQLGPNYVERELVSGYVIDCSFQFADRNGKPLMRQPYFGTTSAPDYGGQGLEDAWRRFRDGVRKGLRFPRMFVRDANGVMLKPKQFFAPGIDGLIEPAVLPPRGHSGIDDFKLKDDPA